MRELGLEPSDLPPRRPREVLVRGDSGRGDLAGGGGVGAALAKKLRPLGYEVGAPPAAEEPT